MNTHEGQTGIPAAEYLRMSTEHQQYSIDNQRAAIQEYARANGFEVVKSYDDAGCSGLTIRKRSGLKQLLEDVVGGTCPYRVILVYDISRWGRFQDIDEAAHYEFLCKEAGIPVHYCAEPFANDDKPSSGVLKALKRSMAAEYSRELGVKVFAGQKRINEKGFRTGGRAGYGLRRMMVSSDGKLKKKLEEGQYKYMQTDRIVLAPGPKEEVAIVRRIFEMAKKKNCAQIAHTLNKAGVPYKGLLKWNRDRVRLICKNPKYAGFNVWGRTIQSLKRSSARLTRSADLWVSKPGAFAPIVRPEDFERVQNAIERRKQPMSEEYMIRRLRRALRVNGRLSEQIINASSGTPCVSQYVRRFGSIRRAYELIGYSLHGRLAELIKAKQKLRSMRDTLMDRIEGRFPQHVEHTSRKRSILRIEKKWRLSVLVCRCYRTPVTNEIRWQLFPGWARKCDFALVCLSNEFLTGFRAFYLMSQISLRKEYQIKGFEDPWLSCGIRLRGVEDLYRALPAILNGKTLYWRPEILSSCD
jgi:DNA invertase Pin-like site-specific DNA recombinase